ncbi:hypothetical protein NBRGN_043_00750 [Nocardia brasiliensis NBRC 14402]|nr:hypothetical protein NBRGN_043_00750 [Nocardia brasiliensis NBRC 14402]
MAQPGDICRRLFYLISRPFAGGAPERARDRILPCSTVRPVRPDRTVPGREPPVGYPMRTGAYDRKPEPAQARWLLTDTTSPVRYVV